MQAMKKIKLLLQLLVAMALLAGSAGAFAQTGPVHASLRGTVLDPQATTVRVVPPRGAHVMLYRNGKVVGWWMHTGMANVTPGRTYGIIATRGTRVLFNAGLVARRGLTDIVWKSGSDVPHIAYHPVRQRPAYVGVSHSPHGHHGSSGPVAIAISSVRYRQLVRHMRAKRFDRDRLAVLKRYVRSYKFNTWQARQLVRSFRSSRYKQAAARTLRGHTGKVRPTVNRRVLKSRTLKKKNRVAGKTTARLAMTRR